MAGNSPIDSNAYIEVGFLLRGLRFTGTTECRYVIKEIKGAIAELDKLKFTYPRTQIEGFAKRLEDVAVKGGQKIITPEREATNLRLTVDCILDTVRSQAKERRLIRLEQSSVSEKLREFASKGTLNERQTYLFHETVSNLETGAYRSAIVMGWNLAYDIIRQWVFDDTQRLADFNSELSKILDKKTGIPKFDPVVQYEDFYEIGEKLVLDVGRGANFLGGNLYDDLRNYLRQRNNYAHASNIHPTVNQANALIDHLVDAVANL